MLDSGNAGKPELGTEKTKVVMQKWALIIVMLGMLLWISPAYALTVDININLLRSIYNIQQNEIPVFTLNRDTGEVIFGDGVTGEGLPPGAENIVGTYRTSGGGDGNVLNTYIIPKDGSSTFVPLNAFPVDASENPVLSFIVSGIDYITVEITDRGVQITPTSIPEPSIMVLLGISILSLTGLRRWWKE